ncbi:hypothetical protein [Entomospira culicis]|uniref:Uncharacterized protein n=1 Tax=Entomospira culicis TaxID=2719989 RepID=A0A968KV26_9SPIO|nr:hypothetical protein [Entomospira culicis]NIZ18447.1 hypothetical protein [Entomospira culicis]NIZ68663.1 hypothetical protein [Entomospira culicis]WDI37262.1 hypothetical protein PVA46_00285 [Entomospira culicis]WDI38891.1 hypothetical protein PVA47_00295 [Entomospira culicis]
MELIEIREIEPEPNAVYYRQKYDGKAHFRSEAIGDFEVPIHFIVETDPLGQKSITASFPKGAEYPLIPLVRLLKERILELHNNGHLY